MTEHFDIYFSALGWMLALALLTWFYSFAKQNVSIVDSLWSIFFLVAAILYYRHVGAAGDFRATLVLTLIAIWALRLSIHLLVRNAGKPEDRRYVQIRRNNEPHFEYKSLYIVFGLQAMLAWVISAPLLYGVSPNLGFGWLDAVALGLWLFGFSMEAAADWQLLKFQNQGQGQGAEKGVLDRGVWRYSRHPNYFGECCIWWAYFLFALSAGGFWTVFSPILMTLLLLKVSGVALMEQGIKKRRPQYQDYIERTSAFIPWPPKSAASSASLSKQ